MSITLRAPLALLAFLPLAAGCGINAGDYVIYRIAFAESSQAADCFPDGEDIDETSDTSTFRSGGTFAIFTSPESKLLEVEGVVLEGEKTEGALRFSGTSDDVEFFGAGDASSTHTTQTLTVTIDPAGANVTGSAVSIDGQTCDGSDCTEFDTFSCTSTSTFVGSRINGVDLEHQL